MSRHVPSVYWSLSALTQKLCCLLASLSEGVVNHVTCFSVPSEDMLHFSVHYLSTYQLVAGPSRCPMEHSIVNGTCL